jgi:DNA-binding response OmpR family regulator
MPRYSSAPGEPAERILIIDDDEALLTVVGAALRAEGFSVFTALDGQQGLEIFNRVAPRLVILDIMMPGMDGNEVCRCLRRTSTVPILFLSAVEATESIVQGLSEGADDYLVKPFTIAELRARVLALLRRTQLPSDASEVLRFGDGELIINCAERRVYARGEEIELTPLEYNLLLFMAKRAGRILTKEILFDAIWGAHADTQIESVKWHIWHLRQKVESDPSNPRFILTERGKGYRFSPL